MKKTISFVMTALLSITMITAQSVADGIKYITYQKNKTAVDVLQKAYNSNSKDANTIYWYGQSLIANKDIAGAKALYQKALQEGVSDAIIIVGMGHIDLLEGADINSAKQKFEQAITATIETKGKNKGRANANILNAIGRANASGSSKIGDPNYAIDKLKQAGEIDLTNSEIYVNMGINYQKIGGEMGGEAVKAYSEAIARDPKNADAMYRIGLIYASQNNKELLEQFYNNAIAADVAFAPAYLSLYRYYEQRDVNRAKEYLDKYLQYADKDCVTDYFYANYLFRAGKYQESLDKAKEMDGATCKDYFRLPILFAYNYDRLGDSIQSKTKLENFFANAAKESIEPQDYELAVKVFSKFPGSEMATAGYLQKAIDNDTSKVNKLIYIRQAADMFGKAKMYKEQVQWLQKYNDLKGSMSDYDHYTITNAAYIGKDYLGTMNYAKAYIIGYPDKPQGYSYNVRAAKALDTTTNPGIAIDALLQYNAFLAMDTLKNKNTIVGNLFYIFNHYANVVKDYPKALEYCDKILALIPGDPDMTAARKTVEARMNRPATSPATKPTTKPATGGKTNTPAASGGSKPAKTSGTPKKK